MERVGSGCSLGTGLNVSLRREWGGKVTCAFNYGSAQLVLTPLGHSSRMQTTRTEVQEKRAQPPVGSARSQH